MKITTTLIHRMTMFTTTTAAVLTMTAFSLRADQTAFNRIFVFGDSLSDTGNFHAITGYPPTPYYEGRFSNGKLWVEYLADSLHMQIQSGDNFAIAGATTGRLNVNSATVGVNLAGLQDEIDSFQANGYTAAQVNQSLFVVWAGANDFFAALEGGIPPATLISNGVYNTAQAVLRLKASGAQHILIANIPDLGVTPYATSVGVGAQITQLCAAYNQVLGATLDALAANGVPTIRVDAFATLDAMATNASAYGFSDTSNAYLLTGGDANEFLFWDTVHPTTVGHAVFGSEAVNVLVNYFSPRQGVGSPAARVNGLNGLVRAAAN